jgi:hypothetical protein
VDHLTAQPEQDPRTIERAKQQVRDRIWALLEREAAAKPPGRAGLRRSVVMSGSSVAAPKRDAEGVQGSAWVAGVAA